MLPDSFIDSFMDSLLGSYWHAHLSQYTVPTMLQVLQRFLYGHAINLVCAICNLLSPWRTEHTCTVNAIVSLQAATKA